MFWAAAYIVLTGLAFAFALGEARSAAPSKRVGVTLLLLLALLLGVFALQEAFDLFGQLVTGNFRQMARQEGWYNNRRPLQAVLVDALVPVGGICLIGLLWLTRRVGKRFVLLAGAITFLVCFGSLQAISLHQWDARLRTRYFGVRLVTWGNAVAVGSALVALWPFVVKPKAAHNASRSRHPV